MSARRWLWVPLTVVQALFVALWSAGWILAALAVLAVSRRPRLALLMARRFWAPGILGIGGVRVTRRGGEAVDFRRPCFFVSNHQSLLDIPALFVALPVPLRFVAKRELARIPFLGWYMSALGMVYVDRGMRAAATRMGRSAVELLRRGGSLVTFPAGTRDAAGAPQGFKPAAFAAPIEAGVPVVPVAIRGTARALPPGSRWLRPARVEVAIGDPIATAGLGPADRRRLAGRAEAAVREMMARP